MVQFLTMKIENTISIDAPLSRAWELTLDVESWPQHTPTITKIERLDSGPIGIGSTALVKQPGQRAKVWTVTDFEPQQCFAWSTRAMGTTMTGRHVMTANESETTQTLTVEIEGPFSSVVGAIVRRPIAKAIAQENQGFKTAAEG